MARKSTDYIIIHCAATRPDMDIGAAEIDKWHRARNFLCIGYHVVIRRDGTVEKGRDLDSPGAHARGYNGTSVGVCMVGGINDQGEPERNFTDAQWDSLKAVISGLTEQYPEAKVIGHNEVDAHKACPSFNVQEWLGILASA